MKSGTLWYNKTFSFQIIEELERTPGWWENWSCGGNYRYCSALETGPGCVQRKADDWSAKSARFPSRVKRTSHYGAGCGAGCTLVERFDIEPLSDFSAKWSNIVGLVLFCIDAKFCKIFVGNLLTRSTRFTCFCTAQTSIFQKVFVKIFRIFWQKFAKFRYFWILFTDFCSDFDEILSEFRR